MRFSKLFIFSTFFLYVTPTIASNTSEEASAQTSELTTPEVIHINLDASNDGWDDADSNSDEDTRPEEYAQEAVYGTIDHSAPSVEEDNSNEEIPLTAMLVKEKEIETELPGKEVNYRINVHSSSGFLIEGRATSDIGKILFDSKLMPSNEVKLSLKLKQKEVDDLELVAYFDLANFTMELDGGKRILNNEHKKLMKLTSSHLQPRFEVQYQDYDIPEHALMLVQMLGYWAMSPEGFVHDKREIVSE